MVNWRFYGSEMRYYWQHRGIRGVVEWLATRLIFTQLRWLSGKYVEIRNDTVRIDGAHFSLNTPLLSTRQKAGFLGLHEAHERIAVETYLDQAHPVIELGGGIGVVSCLTNRRLVDPTQHVVVEPNASLIPLLEANHRLNNCQFTFIEAALAYGGDSVDLHQPRSILGTSILRDSGQKLRAKTITLQHILDTFHLDHVTIICDIEGGEVDLIMREADALEQHVRMLIVELHPTLVGEDKLDLALQRLKALGFTKIDETHSSPNKTRVCIFSKDVQDQERKQGE